MTKRNKTNKYIYCENMCMVFGILWPEARNLTDIFWVTKSLYLSSPSPSFSYKKEMSYQTNTNENCSFNIFRDFITIRHNTFTISFFFPSIASLISIIFHSLSSVKRNIKNLWDILFVSCFRFSFLVCAKETIKKDFHQRQLNDDK